MSQNHIFANSLAPVTPPIKTFLPTHQYKKHVKLDLLVTDRKCTKINQFHRKLGLLETDFKIKQFFVI